MIETRYPAISNRLYKKTIELSDNQMNQFIMAILKMDLDKLESLLHENFTYFDTKSKWETLEYFRRQFEMVTPYEFKTKDVEIFYCTGCQPGNPALMFQNGYWPILEEGINQPKSIMLSFSDGLISDLTLCFEYCNDKRL